MLKTILCAFLGLTAGIAQSQTSLNSISTASMQTGVDSADYFYQKGLLEKQNGRRLESLKNFEKAAKYDAQSKTITQELALAYFDLRR